VKFVDRENQLTEAGLSAALGAAFFAAAPLFFGIAIFLGAVSDVVAFAADLEAAAVVLDFLDFGVSMSSGSSEALRFVAVDSVAVVEVSDLVPLGCGAVALGLVAEALGFVPLDCAGMTLSLAGAAALDILVFGAALDCLVEVGGGWVVEAFDFFVLGCSSGSSAKVWRFVSAVLAGADWAGGETVDGFPDEVLVGFAGRIGLAGAFVLVDAGFAAAAAFFGGMLINVARRSVWDCAGVFKKN
jgi:hypothetical protein